MAIRDEKKSRGSPIPILCKAVQLCLTIVIVGLIVDPTNNGILAYDQNHSGIVYVTWPGYIIINTIFIIGYVIGDRLPKRTSVMFSFLGAILYIASASVVIHDWRRNQTIPINPRPSKQYQDMIISAAVLAIVTSLIMIFETVVQVISDEDEDE